MSRDFAIDDDVVASLNRPEVSRGARIAPSPTAGTPRIHPELRRDRHRAAGPEDAVVHGVQRDRGLQYNRGMIAKVDRGSPPACSGRAMGTP